MPRTTLFVNGFGPEVRARDLAFEFERYGPIIRCDIPALRNPSAAPIAFVEYMDERDAEDAHYYLHGRRAPDGGKLSIQWAKNAPSSRWRYDGPRRPPSPPRGGRGRSSRSPLPPRGRNRSASPRRGGGRDATPPRRRDDSRDRHKGRDRYASRSRSPVDRRSRSRDPVDVPKNRSPSPTPQDDKRPLNGDRSPTPRD